MMCSALWGFYKSDFNSLIHCNLHDIFQLLAHHWMSSSVLDFLPPVFHRPTSALSFMWRQSENRAGCQEVVECWRNCRHLPAFTRRWGRISAEPDSTCSLPLPPRHVGGKSRGTRSALSPPCRILETNMLMEYVTDLPLRCFWMEECLISPPQFRSLELTVCNDGLEMAAGIVTGQGEWEFGKGFDWHDGWVKHDLELKRHQCAKSIETGL